MVEDRPAKRTVKKLVKEFRADKVKNANVIVDVMERLESNDNGTILSAITGLHQIFTHLLHEETIKLPKVPPKDQTANDKLNRWFNGRYEDALKQYLLLLNNEEKAIKELALCSLVKLMQSEGRHPIKNPSAGEYGFPLHRLKAVLSVLVSDTRNNQHLITLLLEYLEYQDFMYYTLKSLSHLVKARKGQDVTVTFTTNIFPLLEKIRIPEAGARALPSVPRLFLHPETEESTPEDDTSDSTPSSPFTLPHAKARQAINVIWPEILQYPLTPDLYRRCLILLPEAVMPHLEKPLVLTGFLMESYDMGGSISLLALQGVFILIHKHHLDYPDFYKKLYALLDPNIFHAKYKARFFMLCDKFLSSSHLPEYLVAAFIKRLARLSLTAPSSSLVLIIKFITNLLIRYPGLHRLIHNPSASAVEDDPYLPAEPDPAKCRAGESSLWEMAALHHHALPYVSKVAGFTQRNLPTLEYNIGDFVEAKYGELFEKACKLNIKDSVATTFHPPQGLFQHPQDCLGDSWTLS